MEHGDGGNVQQALGYTSMLPCQRRRMEVVPSVDLQKLVVHRIPNGNSSCREAAAHRRNDDAHERDAVEEAIVSGSGKGHAVGRHSAVAVAMTIGNGVMAETVNGGMSVGVAAEQEEEEEEVGCVVEKQRGCTGGVHSSLTMQQ
jgi:hypothetical protein